jgi:phytanoyl-CoA hydroxylase
MSNRRLSTLTSHLTGAAATPRTNTTTTTNNVVQPPPAASSTNNNYRYTLDNNVLTKEQRDFYEKNGFIVIPNLISDEKIEMYKKRFTVLCENPKERPASMTVMRDLDLVRQGIKADSEKVITKVQDFHDDNVLFSYCQDKDLLKYVEAFTGPKIVASHTMLINKPTDPGHGTSRHPLHQDHLYFPFKPIDRVVAAWTACEKVTRENGCLIVVPGSHRIEEIFEHGYPDWGEHGANKAYVGILGVTPDVKYVHVPMNKGDTVFFHSLLWHGSGRNQTPNFRKAISCHFVSGDCRFISVKNTIQEPLEDEIKEMAKIKFGKSGSHLTDKDLESFQMSFVWEMKSRVVQGGQMILPME